MSVFPRPGYLEWLIRQKARQIIKVVSGVRRCGKSTLFALFQEYLLANGVSPAQIINISLASPEYESLPDYKALFCTISEKLLPDKKNYIFLDEIQHVPGCQKAAASLLLKENCDLYLAGSNAYFMSGELATLLTGRCIELSMMPLSFREFCDGLNEEHKASSLQEKFSQYLTAGSFPHVLRYQHGLTEARQYMRSVYESILLNDIVKRYNVADVSMLESVTKFLMQNIGVRTTPAAIASALTANNRKIDAKTAERYIRGLTESLMLYKVRRYNIREKAFFTTGHKYYAADVSMRNTLVRGQASDIGRVLENIVYLELRRRGYEVCTGQIGTSGEVDFAAMRDGKTEYYQVSETTLNEDVLRRELAPLQKIRDNYPKYLLTLDTVFGEADYDGIQKTNVLNWLLT
ncbi:MAG: ATP-binding protein [Desulfovibrionaceae bacterium]|nr:ATP-binding protein [Desulfovibrionaceae bacterium]